MKHIVIDARIRRASTGRYVDRLVEHLQKFDAPYRFSMLVQPDDDWQPSNPAFKRVDCRYVQFSLNPLDQINFARQLYRLKADLVHFPMNQQPLLYFGNVLTTCMDLTMLRFTRPGRTPLPIFWLKMLAYRFLFWFGLRKSAHIINISQFVQDDMIRHYPFTTHKASLTYCASEPPIQGVTEPIEAVPSNAKFILHVGSPFPHKNIERLVDAFAVMRQREPELMLVLAGKHEYYFEQLERYIAGSSVGDSVVVTGFVSDAQLKWLYEHAACYVLPSLSEGFGLPGLEAMAHGCPVASSNATCLPEVYGDAVRYFDPLDVADIAEKTLEVVTDDALRKQLVKRGSKQLGKYSWQRMAKQTEAIYNDLLSPRQ